MGKLDRIDTAWTAEAFLKTDQHDFGDAWRYELVDGLVVERAAPAPLHAYMDAILRLRRVEIDIPLAEIYEGVDFAESE